MNNKVLFLDIDGVLNSEIYFKGKFQQGRKYSRFDPLPVLLIYKLVKEFSLKIVISSTWRYGALGLLMKELNRYNLAEHLQKDWYTPVIQPGHRGTEINLWLNEHPEVTDFLIIDDDKNILEEQMSRYINTDIYEGMTEGHYLKAKEILTEIKEYKK